MNFSFYIWLVSKKTIIANRMIVILSLLLFINTNKVSAQRFIQPGDPDYTYDYCYNKLKYSTLIPSYILDGGIYNQNLPIQYFQFKEPLLANKKFKQGHGNMVDIYDKEGFLKKSIRYFRSDSNKREVDSNIYSYSKYGDTVYVNEYKNRDLVRHTNYYFNSNFILDSIVQMNYIYNNKISSYTKSCYIKYLKLHYNDSELVSYSYMVNYSELEQIGYVNYQQVPITELREYVKEIFSLFERYRIPKVPLYGIYLLDSIESKESKILNYINDSALNGMIVEQCRGNYILKSKDTLLNINFGYSMHVFDSLRRDDSLIQLANKKIIDNDSKNRLEYYKTHKDASLPGTESFIGYTPPGYRKIFPIKSRTCIDYLVFSENKIKESYTINTDYINMYYGDYINPNDYESDSARGKGIHYYSIEFTNKNKYRWQYIYLMPNIPVGHFWKGNKKIKNQKNAYQIVD